MDRETDCHTDRQTHRETDTQMEITKARQTQPDRHSQTQTEPGRHRQRDTNRQIYIETDTGKGRQRQTSRDRQTGTRIHRQTYSDRHTIDIHTETVRQRPSHRDRQKQID